MSKFLLLLCIGLLTAQSAFARKRAEMEELESILDDIDDTKKARDLSNSRHNAASGSADADREAARESAAICANHVCGWGKTCVAVKGRPVCECVSQCPDDGNDPLAQVCASNNQTYGSLCELYRQRCVCKRRNGYESECHSPANSKIHLEYLGACKELDHCTPELMTQFPERMSDWLFQVMKELKKRRELHGVEWEELISEAEGDDKKKHVYPVIWKFCDLDIKPHDKHVSHHELIPITAPVIPMESCIKPFLENCDADKNGSITIQEWGICLGLKEGEIQERC